MGGRNELGGRLDCESLVSISSDWVEEMDTMGECSLELRPPAGRRLLACVSGRRAFGGGGRGGGCGQVRLVSSPGHPAALRRRVVGGAHGNSTNLKTCCHFYSTERWVIDVLPFVIQRDILSSERVSPDEPLTVDTSPRARRTRATWCSDPWRGARLASLARGWARPPPRWA